LMALFYFVFNVIETYYLYTVYILHSETLNKYYVGSTQDLKDRLERHNNGRSNYTRKGYPWKLITQFQCETRGESMRLENKIKNLSLPQMQLSIFDAHSETFDEIRKLLEGADINRLTPVEALLKLQEIKSKLK